LAARPITTVILTEWTCTAAVEACDVASAFGHDEFSTTASVK